MLSNHFYCQIVNNGAIFGRLMGKDESILVFSLLALNIKDVTDSCMLLYTLD